MFLSNHKKDFILEIYFMDKKTLAILCYYIPKTDVLIYIY